jgi:O-antigen ligase
MVSPSIENIRQYSLRKILPVLLVIQLLIFSLVFFAPLRVVVIASLGIISLLFIFVYSDPIAATLIIASFITIALPRPTGRAFVFKAEEVLPVVTVLLLIFYFLQGDHARRSVGKIGYWLIGFFIIVLIAAVIGILKERDKILILDEALMFAMWGGYFIVVKTKLTQEQIKHIFLIIIASSLFVSLYYIFEFKLLAGITRFRTDQQHIFNFTVPFLFAILLYDKNKTRKIVAGLLIIPMAIAVYVTLTRALWLLVPLALFLQYLYFIRENLKRKKLITYLLPILIVILIAVLGFMLLEGLFGVSNLLGERFASFKFLESDLSLLARAELSKYVVDRVRFSPFFGVGLADYLRYQYFPTLGRFNVYWLDNTYMQLLWKTGIIGTLLFLGFLYYFLKRAWYVLKNSVETFDKIIGSSIFFSFAALAISGLQCGIMVGYRFNFVWAILAGITEIKAQEIKKQKELQPI